MHGPCKTEKQKNCMYLGILKEIIFHAQQEAPINIKFNLPWSNISSISQLIKRHVGYNYLEIVANESVNALYVSELAKSIRHHGKG